MAPRGGGGKLGGALPKVCIFCPKSAFFGPKRPRNRVKTAKGRETLRTLHVRLDFLVTSRPLLPSTSVICPRKKPPNGQKCPKLRSTYVTLPQNQERAVSWATWLKTKFRGHLVHPQPLNFCRFQASQSRNEVPRPPYQWPRGGARGQPGLRTVGANGGSTRVPGAGKKRFFPKLFLDHLGCSNKCL